MVNPLAAQLSQWAKSSKAATGLVEFETVEEACEAVVMVNNTEIETEKQARPYIMKLCFARN